MGFLDDLIASLLGAILAEAVPDRFWKKRWVRVCRFVLLAVVLVGVAVVLALAVRDSPPT